MENNAAIERFFRATEELAAGKFILADSKIGEMLRSIAASAQLTRFFAAATEGYDYAAAKRECLRIVGSERGRTRGELCLPKDRGELIAFVFCLLAEIDAGEVKFGDFILQYFYEDGSYTASYEKFINGVIRPFRDILRGCFPPEASAAEPVRQMRGNGSLLNELIGRERTRIAAMGLPQEDALAAECILGEMQAALVGGRTSVFKALLCGYVYFLQVTRTGDENSDALFSAAEEADR